MLMMIMMLSESLVGDDSECMPQMLAPVQAPSRSSTASPWGLFPEIASGSPAANLQQHDNQGPSLFNAGIRVLAASSYSSPIRLPTPPVYLRTRPRYADGVITLTATAATKDKLHSPRAGAAQVAQATMTDTPSHSQTGVDTRYVNVVPDICVYTFGQPRTGDTMIL